jgi:hypothetical protein
MRYVESRAQWEHTLEQEEDSGWSKVTDEDMPPSLVKLLDAKHARLVEVADKLQAARARLEKAEELLRAIDHLARRENTSAESEIRDIVRAFLAAQPVPGEPKP